MHRIRASVQKKSREVQRIQDAILRQPNWRWSCGVSNRSDVVRASISNWRFALFLVPHDSLRSPPSRPISLLAFLPLVLRSTLEDRPAFTRTGLDRQVWNPSTQSTFLLPSFLHRHSRLHHDPAASAAAAQLAPVREEHRLDPGTKQEYQSLAWAGLQTLAPQGDGDQGEAIVYPSSVHWLMSSCARDGISRPKIEVALVTR